MDDKFFEFYPCKVCRAMVSGPHACSPLALPNVTRALRQLTEERVRQIVREEFAMLRNGER